jgi:hypothetical protein
MLFLMSDLLKPNCHRLILVSDLLVLVSDLHWLV